MARARREEAWERTSWVLSKLHNTHFRNRRTPAQCNPLLKKGQSGDRIPITRDNLMEVGRALIGKGKGKRARPESASGGRTKAEEGV